MVESMRFISPDSVNYNFPFPEAPWPDKRDLLDGKTGSAFLAFTRELAVAQQGGRELTAREKAQVQLAIDVFGPDKFVA